MRNNIFKIKKDTLLLYSFLLPAVIVVVVMTIIPLVNTFIYSFQNYMLTKPDSVTFTGINNYLSIFTDAKTLDAIKNTIVFSGFSVITSIIIGFICALIINSIKHGKTFFRVVLFTPMLLSSVVVGIMWKLLLNYELGVINYFLKVLGLNALNWFGDHKLAFITLILVDVWQWTSYCFILILAGLEAMPQDCMESAIIDGANSLQKFWYIILPLILPVLEIAAVFRIIWSFRNFELPFSLTKGGPGNATETLPLSIYRYAFERFDIGISSALSVIMFIILMAVSIVILRSFIGKRDN